MAPRGGAGEIRRSPARRSPARPGRGEGGASANLPPGALSSPPHPLCSPAPGGPGRRSPFAPPAPGCAAALTQTPRPEASRGWSRPAPRLPSAGHFGPWTVSRLKARVPAACEDPRKTWRLGRGRQRRHTSGQLPAKPSVSAGTRPFTLHLAWDSELQEDLSSSA
ncbi:translation initiation factor IF-2-like [Myotis myotis]|uniref:translation initiation factor IF-2-like n=1 Tax=Myotis myotis TaxID=51298 RepID=UPI00174B1B3E|nr:translation initiation factor IF-2-like [Myotis myotis]